MDKSLLEQIPEAISRWGVRSSLTLLIALTLLNPGCTPDPDSFKKKHERSNQSVSGASSILPGTVVNLTDRERFAYRWTWSDYQGRVYTDTISVSRDEAKAAGEDRLHITAISPTFPMPNYAIVARSNTGFAKLLAARLKSLAQSRSLSGEDALNMAVTMVQNIPYTLVHNGTHEFIEQHEINTGGNFIKEYHKKPENIPLKRELFGGCEPGVEPCGVYAPAEFAAGLRGDCDTRTVFLYVLLKEMGFDVAVANGPGHSMLVTSVVPQNPAAPFIIHKGMKYYFWETTVFYNNASGSGPRNGDTPRDFNPAQWNIVLI